MDPPTKKRSLFAIPNFFRTSATPPAESDANARAVLKAGADEPLAPLPVEFGNASTSAPESPVKRASESQLASRKIIGRAQGPSSKLSQSFSASDFSTRLSSATPKASSFSGMASAAPRRMPGDNPYKTTSSSFSSTISHPPTNLYNKTTNFSGASTTPRNIFRNSAIYQRPAIPSFSPRVPTNTIRQAFPPNTPGKVPRGAAADVTSRGLGHTAPSELFTMRIPEPPRHLTGEVLAREVPDDPARTGSVYADEFLAHYCPPDLDEHQRRQFFCILDLRRLKYAADEVFTKKDWKINITNFAKEFEKSRSLIMLRYGLYEFKTVRASEAVKKEWKQKHGIASSEDEVEAEPTVTYKANVSSKRKAEDELTQTGNALTASASNANKRSRAPEAGPPTPFKNKRKADAVGEPDENQPSKLLKPTATPQKTPSATKSVFESIVNNTLATSTTPAKSPSKNSLFGSSTAPKLPNGTVGRPVFDTASKPQAAPTNIFGHLSDASKGSPNDDADAESETSSNAGEAESEGQEASQSDEPSAAPSVGEPTPQYKAGKAAAVTANGASSASSDGGDSSQGRSIFDRITRGTDGQPVRKFGPQESKSPFATSPDQDRSASPGKDQASAAPSNNTWNTSTPIKFQPSGSALFGSTAPKPAASATIDFGMKKTESAQAAPKEAAPQSMFGALTGKADEPAPASVTPAASIFSSFSAKPAAPATAAPSIFGSVGAPASTGAPLFGAGTIGFGQAKVEEKKSAATPAPATSLFGAAPTSPKPAPTKANAFQSSVLFGNQSKTEPAAQPPMGGLFGKPQSTETPQATQPSSSSLFGGSSAKPLFGAAAPPSQTEEPAAKKPFSGGESSSGSALFAFGQSAAAPAQSKPLFGATTTPAASETKSLFGAAGASSTSQESKPLFGTAPATRTEAPKSLFATNPSSQTEAAKPSFSFGNTALATPAPIFGGFGTQASGASQAPPATIFGGAQVGSGTSFTFGAGGSDATAVKNPFASNGATSAPSSFTFGSGANNDGGSQTPSTSFTFGSAAPPPTISFGGVSDSNSQPQQANMFGGASGGGSIFNFGGNSTPSDGPSMFSQRPPQPTTMFGSSLAPGGGTSTGTNSPFTFGGASSLATTPATGTPEPAAEPEENRGTNADGDEAPQEQISLTEGGPGEEDEAVVLEVRAKALKLVPDTDSDDDSGSAKDKTKNPWKTQGVGPLRILKSKATGAVRLLLRAEPRGHIALNRLVLPNFNYLVEPPAGGKYVKLTTSTEDGAGLETWMLQVKTNDLAKKLAATLEDNKKANA